MVSEGGVCWGALPFQYGRPPKLGQVPSRCPAAKVLLPSGSPSHRYRNPSRSSEVCFTAPGIADGPSESWLST